MKKMLEAVVVTGVTLAIGAVITVPGMFSGHGQDVTADQADGQKTGWWASIGGCGVAGGAGGGGGGAKWVGRGATGGLIDMQVMSSTTIGGDYFYQSLSPSYTYKFLNNNSVNFGASYSIKHGTYRYNTNEAPITQTVAGPGDISLGYNRTFGSSGQGSAGLSVAMPTAQYDHRRFDLWGRGKADEIGSYVTPELQTGTGVWGLNFSGEYSIDKDWGPMIFGVSYSKMVNSLEDFMYPGAQNDIWAPENFETGDLYGLTDMWGRTNHYYIREETGDSVDLLPSGEYAGQELKGDYFGDSFGVNFAIGYKEEMCVHSFACSYSYKISKDWYVRDKNSDEIAANTITTATDNYYYIKPVSTGSHHNFTIAYGLEISHMYFPFFIAGGMAFSEKEINNYTLTLGLKGSFL